ncbi:MAG TPA: ElyC/SanA/YdcF family protein [Smithellaceae bacterium]|nr:ElyC/SanA/YdcF family protein [Smithellaceae bacterium]HRS89279.1 ElyC/SanA/YdcF family protein [Smithellaceae bacterium]HRV27055.1 ElyC/SanA/YdcF family protein [Smithellaceae bacterium]
MMIRRRSLAIFFSLAIIIILSIICAPRFLLYSFDVTKTDKKVDTIVLLLGESFSARKKEAHLLSHKGLANYLIIPAYYKMYQFDGGGMKEVPLSRSAFSEEMENDKISSLIYENTHLEILQAKIIMSRQNFNSVVFVSSPYHMRRIKIIVSHVFKNETDDIYYMATRFERAPGNFWQMSLRDWKNVLLEYLKIIWFFLYAKII